MMSDKVLIDREWYERVAALVATWDCEPYMSVFASDGDVREATGIDAPGSAALIDAEGCYRLILLPWGKQLPSGFTSAEDTAQMAHHLCDLLHAIDELPQAEEPN